MKLTITTPALCFALAMKVPEVFAQTRNEENQYWSMATSDDCVIEGPCIKSHPGAGVTNYGNHERCDFVAKKDGTLRAVSFEVEVDYDWLSIDGNIFDGSAGITTDAFVVSNSLVIWDTDDSTTSGGFEFCYQGSGGSGPFWSLGNTNAGAECLVDGRCIKSHPGAGVNDYTNDEYCEFTALQPGTIDAIYFETESGTLLIDGGVFSPDPQGTPLVTTPVTASDPVIWDTDRSIVQRGFEVCYLVGGGGNGDPHFRKWSGDWFDFHGICDQVLTSSPSFDSGLGLDIHVRTKPRYEYSYIEAAAVKIGKDVLQVGSWGQYWLNGVENVELPFKMANKFFVDQVVNNKKQHKFVITLDNFKTESIVINVFKDMVNVNVENATTPNFGTSTGLLGSFPDGVMLARDGATILEDDIIFGQEWQVSAGDPSLFLSSNPYQQDVGVCVAPIASEGRRLGEGIEMEAAEKTCAHHKEQIKRDMCIFDVMAMGDLEVAEIHGAF